MPYDRECEGCGRHHLPPDTQCPICNGPLTLIAPTREDLLKRMEEAKKQKHQYVALLQEYTKLYDIICSSQGGDPLACEDQVALVGVAIDRVFGR